MPAHVAPLDIIFYEGTLFPKVKKGDAFISWHGSWNREPPMGYRVIHMSFNDSTPTGYTHFFYYDPEGDVDGQSGQDIDSNWKVTESSFQLLNIENSTDQ